MSHRQHPRTFAGRILVPAEFLRSIFHVHDQEGSLQSISGFLKSRHDDMMRIRKHRRTVIQQILILSQNYLASIRIHPGQNRLLLLPAFLRIGKADDEGSIRRKHRFLMALSGMRQKRDPSALQIRKAELGLMAVRNAMRLIELIHDLFDLDRLFCSLFPKQLSFFPRDRLQKICIGFFRVSDSFRYDLITAHRKPGNAMPAMGQCFWRSSFGQPAELIRSAVLRIAEKIKHRSILTPAAHVPREFREQMAFFLFLPSAIEMRFKASVFSDRMHGIRQRIGDGKPGVG